MSRLGGIVANGADDATTLVRRGSRYGRGDRSRERPRIFSVGIEVDPTGVVGRALKLFRLLDRGIGGTASRIITSV